MRVADLVLDPGERQPNLEGERRRDSTVKISSSRSSGMVAIWAGLLVIRCWASRHFPPDGLRGN
jgi:hypothetical protein